MTNKQEKNRLDSSSPNNEDQNYPSTSPGERIFEIHVRGHLDSTWSEWLEGLEVKLLENGEMILLGYIQDQAALMGVLNKLSHLNLTLISVNEVKRTN